MPCFIPAGTTGTQFASRSITNEFHELTVLLMNRTEPSPMQKLQPLE